MENIVDKIYRDYRSTKGLGQTTIGNYAGYQIKVKTLSDGLFRFVELQVANMKKGENLGKSSPVYRFYDNQLKNALSIVVKHIDKGIIESEWEKDVKFVNNMDSILDKEI